METIGGSLIPVIMILSVFAWYSRKNIRQWIKDQEFKFWFKLLIKVCNRDKRDY